MNNNLREEVNQLHAHICKGLADPNRILLLYNLVDGPLSVTELVDATELPQPTVSRHLGVLRERNMVNATRSGQSVLYEITDKRIIDALDLLRAVMADGLRSQGALISNI
jgi:ArsR family transcriptional regulator